MSKGLQGDREIFFFVVFRQGVQRNLEWRQSNIRRATDQFKINRLVALKTSGKELVAQQSNFMRQAMVPVVNAVDAAFQDFIAAAKLLHLLRRIGLRFD